MATLPVKWFHSGMAGAPVLTGTIGAMIAVLDACLVNGFNLLTLTGLAVAANVATATKASHGFIVDQVVEIAGATPAALNGQWRVAAVTTNTFTFATTGISDQTATGTITAKTPGAGWEKQFSGTNLAAYRSTNTQSNKPVLRVDDTGNPAARVVGYESMTSIGAGAGPFPTEAIMAGGGYWPKSWNASVRPWVVVADRRMVFFFGDAASYGTSVCFGEFTSVRQEGDAYAAILTVTNVAAINNPNYCHIGAPGNAGVGSYTPRSYTGFGGNVSLIGPEGPLPGVSVALVSGFASGNNPPFPSPISNKFSLFKTWLREGTQIRCREFPGLLYTPNQVPQAHLSVFSGDGPLADRRILAVKNNQVQVYAQVFFDITGPWA